jgi:agmatinase
MPTFLSAPHVPVDNNDPDFGDLQVAIVGVPMDLGVTNRTGSRFGPRAVRTIERIGPYNHTRLRAGGIARRGYRRRRLPEPLPA